MLPNRQLIHGVTVQRTRSIEMDPVFVEFLTPVAVFGIQRESAVSMKLHQDENLFLQLVQIKQHLVRERVIFMFKGNIIGQIEKRTVRDFDIRMNDHIIALYPLEFGKFFDAHSGITLALLILDHEKMLRFAEVKLKVKLDVKALKQKLKKHLKFQIENLSLVHNGILLADEDTLEGAGVSDHDRITLVDLGSDVSDKHLERLLIVNAGNSDKVITNHEPAVGEPDGMRIIHNLNPNNFGGHENMKSAEVCKSLLERIKSELLPNIMGYEDKNSVLFNSIFRKISHGNYAHASDLMSDLHETMIKVKANYDCNEGDKKAWKQAMEKLINFYEKTDRVFKTTCGQYYEPFEVDSFLSSESFPVFSILPKDKSSIETVLYTGPKRDGKHPPNFPTVKLRAFTSKTTIQDVINSYKFYANLSTSIGIDGLSFNNKSAYPTDTLCEVLGGMFEKNYVTISALTEGQDFGDLDNILEFIEGKKEEKASKRKRKNKVKNQTKDKEEVLEKLDEILIDEEDEAPIQQDVETAKPPKDIETMCVSDNLAESCPEKRLLEATLKNETDLLNENKSNLDQLIGGKSKEMKDLLVKISTVEDQNVVKDKRITAIGLEIDDLEARVAKLKVEKQLIEKEKDLAKITVQKLNSKKVKLENYIEEEMKKTKDRENEIKIKIRNAEERITALDVSDTKEDMVETESKIQNTEQDSKKKLLDFLTNSIQEKENDLECPVCLETATVPIYSCQESHLICSSCRPKVAECPECRLVYADNDVLRRHRYAEKTARELERLKEERGKIL